MKNDRPSETAYWVALGCYVVLLHEKKLNWDGRIVEYVDRFLQTGPKPFQVARTMARFKIGRLFLEKSMSAFIPGMFMHYVARKKKIEDWARFQITHGCEQVVIISGGFDTLGIRLSLDYPNTNVFELDHSATQAQKTRALGDLKHFVTFVRADLSRTTIADALGATHFDKSLKTILIIEGVLMYLTKDQVQKILYEISKLTQNSVLTFTFFDTPVGSIIGFEKGAKKLVNLALKKNDEPFQWSCTKENLKSLLEESGWQLKRIMDHLDLALSPVPKGFEMPARGECIAFCEIAKNETFSDR